MLTLALYLGLCPFDPSSCLTHPPLPSPPLSPLPPCNLSPPLPPRPLHPPPPQALSAPEGMMASTNPYVELLLVDCDKLR